MNRFFYLRLALSNLRNNRKAYLPYLCTCIFTVAMFYIVSFLAYNESIDRMTTYGSVLSFLLNFGTRVIGIFAVIFLYYTNSFLVKRRKKEFGLFHILGMEKKHIGRTLLWETVYTAIISLAAGLAIGILLSKAAHLLLLNLLEMNIQFGYAISFPSMGQAVMLFGAIFFINFVSTLLQLSLVSPLELLKGSQVGEREPRVRWLLLVLGLATLGGGYYLSVAMANPVDTLVFFFPAVILVIIGTFCLFTAGSIAVLKLMRKRKGYYYTPKHFVSVSTMLYRMKQNAAGLASICILSTMVLVTVATTVSLYLGLEDALQVRYPSEITARTHYNVETDDRTGELCTRQILEEEGVEAQNFQSYVFFNAVFVEEGSRWQWTQEYVNWAVDAYFTSQDELGEDLQLKAGEVYIYSAKAAYAGSEVTIFDRTYTVAGAQGGYKGFQNIGSMNDMSNQTYHVIFDSFDSLKQAIADRNEITGYGNLGLYLNTTFELEDTDRSAELAQRISEVVWEVSGHVESRSANRGEFLELYGGLFFLGILLGTLFLVATALIFYYKQISEGHDDQKRFAIMKQVGLDEGQIRQSINGQVLLMFFLPLVTACVHLAFAFPSIYRMISMFNLRNMPLFIGCTLGTIGVFAVIYTVVYRLTAREYYKIVNA